MAVANVVVVTGKEKKSTFYKADALRVLTNYDFQFSKHEFSSSSPQLEAKTCDILPIIYCILKS